jgi:DNA-binding NtrC family response regulator
MKPILIVDDEAIVRESIRDWLNDAGYKVSVAESGEAALKLIEQQDFGMMILDLRLPGIDGLAVLKRVKVIKPEIKTVVITAYPTMLTQEEASKLGAIDYLVKPVFPDKLEELIRETIGQADKEKK